MITTDWLRQRYPDLTDEQVGIIVWLYQGFTQAQISAKIGCDQSTISRNVRRIKEICLPRA